MTLDSHALNWKMKFLKLSWKFIGALYTFYYYKASLLGKELQCRLTITMQCCLKNRIAIGKN